MQNPIHQRFRSDLTVANYSGTEDITPADITPAEAAQMIEASKAAEYHATLVQNALALSNGAAIDQAEFDRLQRAQHHMTACMTMIAFTRDTLKRGAAS